MSETIDDNSFASDPGGIRLSHEKMCSFHPELYQYQGWCNRIQRKFTKSQKFWQTRHREHLQTSILVRSSLNFCHLTMIELSNAKPKYLRMNGSGHLSWLKHIWTDMGLKQEMVVL
jgi:hypothetical protein